MAEIEEECTFITKADEVKYTTQTNGDIIIISGIHLSKKQAATLAWLVNHTNKNLVFEVKLDG
jgi:hypothetical protein